MPETPENKVAEKITLNYSMNSLWADNFQVGVREDNICLIRFLAALPEQLIEQSRIMTSRQNLMALIDLLCSTLNYYPEKPKKSPKKSKSKKS